MLCSEWFLYSFSISFLMNRKFLMVSNADSFSDGRMLFISLKHDYGKKGTKNTWGWTMIRLFSKWSKTEYTTVGCKKGRVLEMHDEYFEHRRRWETALLLHISFGIVHYRWALFSCRWACLQSLGPRGWCRMYSPSVSPSLCSGETYSSETHLPWGFSGSLKNLEEWLLGSALSV